MNFTSQICTTKEQSERLLKMGIKVETADMHHYKWSEGYWDIQSCPPRGTESCYIPAWSLHRLIEIYDKTCIFWTDCLDNPYEAMISRIADKIKCGELNKEYLE